MNKEKTFYDLPKAVQYPIVGISIAAAIILYGIWAAILPFRKIKTKGERV